MVAGVTGDMKPSARIDKSWVPTLQDIGGVRESASQSMQSISFRIGGEGGGDREEEREEEGKQGWESH